MGYVTLKVQVSGLSPLLMHNARLADPDDEFAVAIKEISGKRKKTQEDRQRMADLEWEGGLYLDTDGRLFVPSQNLDKMLVEGARLSKRGKEVERGIYCGDGKLMYEGPKSIDKLRADPRFRDRRPMTVQRQKVMRTRPRFDVWSVEFEVSYHTEMWNDDDVRALLKTCAEFVGLMDGRPRNGRFLVAAVAVLAEAA